MSAETFLPVCVECRSAKVKCEKVFPCSRCVSLGLPCLPQTRKRGRPSDGDLPLMDVRLALRAYAVHLDDRAREMIAALIGLQFWKNKWFERNVGHRPVAPIKDPDFVAKTWLNMEASCASPSPDIIIRNLENFEEWLPAEMLALRKCATKNSATLFQYHSFGCHRVQPNKRFEEMFANAEDILDQDVEAAKAFAIRDLICGVNTETLRKQRPPDILHRMCSNSDHADYFQDQISMLVGKGGPGRVVGCDGVYSMQLKNGQDVICQSQRWFYISAGGETGAMFMVMTPLPGENRYLRDPPPQNVGLGRRGERLATAPTHTNNSVKLTGLAESDIYSLGSIASAAGSVSLGEDPAVKRNVSGACSGLQPSQEQNSVAIVKLTTAPCETVDKLDEVLKEGDVEIVIPDSFIDNMVLNLGEFFEWVA
eukprot:TRINITY_DN6496_c0_g1_i3.p1 TRINITY_DN6496_c0_g1~~TRINITY_DN6496_c0_g1_i3.p1  ORF type:complete len:424 (-),score=47.89 TRINITY_DN6496_c0_g1_i3:418-1689(-)